MFQIAELSYKSLLRVALEPKQLSAQPYTGGAVVAHLKHLADTLTGDESLIGFDASVAREHPSARKARWQRRRKYYIDFQYPSVLDLTPRIATRLDAALAVADECEEYIEKMLEQINVHRGANTFHIYPDVGCEK